MKKRISIGLFEFLIINIGLMLTALSIIGFLAPAKLAAGGVSGIATITWYLFEFPIGTMMLIINVPLFVLGIKVFGKGYGIKGIYGVLMLSFYCYLLENTLWLNPLQDIAERNLVLATVYGGVIGGIGMGMVLSFESNTGGTDIIAQIFNKYLNVPLGTGIIIVDTLIILSSAITFGIEVMLYAYICIYLTGKMINLVEDFTYKYYSEERLFLILNRVFSRV